MISPQSIAVAAASSKLIGQEGQLFRLTLPHSLGLLGIICVLTYLQAYALPGMVPALPPAAGVMARPGLSPLGPGGVGLLTASALVLGVLSYFNLSSQRPRAGGE